MTTKKFFRMQIIYFCIVCVFGVFCACDNDVDLPVMTEQDIVRSHLTMELEKDTVFISSDILHQVPNYNIHYELLSNGDYFFSYVCQYQIVSLWARNVTPYQFGNPESPVMSFRQMSNNIYQGCCSITIPYVSSYDNEVKEITVSKDFTAVVVL